MIEEPEAHLYPNLRREFLRFLRENQQLFKHQYLIATYSNVFIDELVKMEGSVFYVHTEKLDDNKLKYSQVSIFDREQTSTLFKELGIKP